MCFFSTLFNRGIGATVKVSNTKMSGWKRYIFSGFWLRVLFEDIFVSAVLPLVKQQVNSGWTCSSIRGDSIQINNFFERPHHASYSHKSAGCKSTRPASVLPAVRILTTVCGMSVFAMSVLIDLTWAEVVFLTSNARDNPPSLFIALSRMLVMEANVRGSTILVTRSLLWREVDTYCCTSLSTSIHTWALSLHRSYITEATCQRTSGVFNLFLHGTYVQYLRAVWTWTVESRGSRDMGSPYTVDPMKGRLLNEQSVSSPRHQNKVHG